MKMSRRDRKMFNQGKQLGHLKGYAEGYAKGVHDGNPFNAIIDAVSNMAEMISNHPELLEEIRRQEAEEMEDENDTE